MPCKYWKCLLFGHKEKYGHVWMKDNIAYRVFKTDFSDLAAVVGQDLWCMNNAEWIPVKYKEFKRYIVEEAHRAAQREMEREEADGTFLVLE